MDRVADPPPPTRNEPAENSLMACLLLFPEVWERIGVTLPESRLWSSQNAAVLRAMQRLVRTGNPPDDVAVLVTELQKADPNTNWMAVVTQLMGFEYRPDHADHYLRLVNDAASRRDAQAAAFELQRGVLDPGADVREVLSKHRGRIDAIEESQSPFEAADMATVMLEVAAQLEAAETPGLSTGFDDLDERLHGGFRPGTLNILAARPSVGKSALAGNIATNISKRGISVLIASMEMRRVELGQRLLSAQSGVPASKIASRNLTEFDWYQLTEAQSRLADLPLRIDHESGRTVPQIGALARVHKRRHGLGLIVIDYLQLMTPEDSRVHREQQVAAMSRQLKVLAGDLEVPILALCQLNRALENREQKRPRLSDLRDSGCIEQDADLVAFIDRPSTYDTSAHPSDARLIIAKNRNGTVGDVALTWNGSLTRFEQPISSATF